MTEEQVAELVVLARRIVDAAAPLDTPQAGRATTIAQAVIDHLPHRDRHGGLGELLAAELGDLDDPDALGPASSDTFAVSLAAANLASVVSDRLAGTSTEPFDRQLAAVRGPLWLLDD